MSLLTDLKKRSEELSKKKIGFGITGKKKKKFVIPSRLIEEEVKDLYQYCDNCKTETSFSRITYDGGKRACKCLNCNSIKQIATQNG